MSSVLSASSQKSLAELSHRRARTAFSVLTLVLAVASVSLLALPALIDRGMQAEVTAGRLADATFAFRPAALPQAQLDELAALPGVAAVEARSSYEARVLIGERRAPARLVGVRDFARQQVDVVRVSSGALPAANEVLADVQDANVGLYAGAAGDRVTVLRSDGTRSVVGVSGRGRSLPGGEAVQDDDLVVLYADAATVAALSGEAGFSELAVRFSDHRAEAVQAAVAAISARLTNVPGFTAFVDLPSVRAPGGWPGKADTETFGRFVAVVTVLALLSAVVLVSNTMSTLVAEQTGEIAVMRAIGARRRQVAAVYLRTALLLGSIAGVIGAVAGCLFASWLASYFGRHFWAVRIGFGIDVPVAVLGLATGVLAPALAALPAVRRGVRADLHEAMSAEGSALGGDAGGPPVRRLSFLPPVAQIGIANVGRRKRRSAATVLIVAVAVANLLAVLGLAASATRATRSAWRDHGEDLEVWTTSRALFDDRAFAAVASAPDVSHVEAVVKNTVSVGGREAFVWGVETAPLLHYRLAGGRWFTAEESAGSERVAVVERNLAQIAGIAIGDRITVATANGSASFLVVGRAKNQQEDGTAIYIPLTTARTLLGVTDGATTYWVRAASPDPASVDRVTVAVEDRLRGLGYDVGAEVRYIAERDEVADNRTITTTIGLLGFVVVATSLVGLANAITTNVLERTREIGILRSIGARAKDVRRIFMAEGLVLALGGWALGIPLGYALDRLLVRLVWEIADVRVPFVFPWANVVLALAGTLALALAVLALPVRRAVRFRPGDALRYA